MSAPYDYSPRLVPKTELSEVNYVTSRGGKATRAFHDTMGLGIHRSGWSPCYRELASIETSFAIDDFVEQTLLHSGNRYYHSKAFVGFFHYPPDDDVPGFAQNQHAALYRQMFASEAWSRTEANLAAAVVLSNHLATWLRNRLRVPVFAVRHPTATNVAQWSQKRFSRNPKLLQVGTFYRDTHAIYRVPTRIPKLRVLDRRRPWIKAWDDLVAKQVIPGEPIRAFHNDVTEIMRLSNESYDDLLSSSIVVSRYYAASASNVVVECMARSTPILVNRLPAIEEYLGADYPLYFDCITANGEELTERAIDAHIYLAGLEKSWLSMDTFRRSVADSLATLSV